MPRTLAIVLAAAPSPPRSWGVCVPVVSPTLVKPVAYVLCLPINRMGAAGLLPPPSFHSAGLHWLYTFIGAFPLSYFLPEFIVNNDDSDKR